MDYYFYKTDKSQLNEYGFDTNNFDGAFRKLNYDVNEIEKHKFKIITREDLTIFKKNTAYLFEILDYIQKRDLKVIIVTVPLYKTYLHKRNPNIVRRRDSILSVIKTKYDNVVLLDKEPIRSNSTFMIF